LPFALEKRKEKSDPALVLGNPAVPGAPPLEYSEREAQEVAELYGTKTHNGKEATETLFRSEASQAGLIHLACHGEYNPVNPLFSRLLLAPDGQNDGSLNVYELYDIELPQVDLVTLSACQTNLGQLSGGDEVIGLSRALIYAGAPTIVASLWAVEDEATAELMVSFYRHLKEGLSKAEALRAAQVEMLSQEKRAHPYYWAAFGLTGDPGKVSGYTHAPPHTTPPAYIERRKAQADALYGEGEELYKAGEYKVAQEKFQAAVEIYRDIESVQFYWKLEQYQERLGHYEKTLPTFRESGDHYGEGQTLNVIGITNEILGRNEEALKYYQEAEAIFHELGGRKEEAFVLNNIGVINRSLSQYQESLRYYQEALAIERELGDRAREEYILFNIRSFYQGQGQAQEALEYYQEALAIERELGDRAREGNTLYNLGVVHRNSERYQEALKYFEEALAIYRELSDRAGEGYTLVSMGVAYEGMGQDQEALKYYEDALAILHEIGDYYAEQGTIDIIERFHEKTQAK
jgi:tetratricopeptide (TPR) repeat protein